MKRWIPVVIATVASAMAAEDRITASSADVPLWAFPPPKAQTVAGSALKLSEVQTYDRTRAVDWFPDEHPPMPASVAGRAPVFACGFCHLPNGGGRPENAALAGMSADYIKQQIADMKTGVRVNDPHFTTGRNMLITAKVSTDADIASAAEYFANVTYRKRVRVVEAAEIPLAIADSIYFFDQSGAREPLGQRIIEGADDPEAFELRDSNTTYTAYAPIGSLARGAALAKGADGVPVCEVCHGQGLKGGPVGPPLAGRFPTGLFRQLYAFKMGFRNGTQAAFMKPVVQLLDEQDMIALAAYAASLDP